jgi:hypothetical protein
MEISFVVDGTNKSPMLQAKAGLPAQDRRPEHLRPVPALRLIAGINVVNKQKLFN